MADKADHKTGNDATDGVFVLKDVTKKFGDAMVLDSISLWIERGKTTVVIGPSGCGKTVLLKHLIVLLRPTSGNVFFNGTRIDNLTDDQLDLIRPSYGFLFQGGALFDSLTVAENIMFPIMQQRSLTDSFRLKRIVETKLAMVGLNGYENRYPAELSGGQKKRVALSRAIALDPEVILYDEPTTGLDPINSDMINELILKLEKQMGVTTVAVTHDMTSAYKIADRIIMLSGGRVIADGDAGHIRNHPDPVVQQFITGHVSESDLEVLDAVGTEQRPVLPKCRRQGRPES